MAVTHEDVMQVARLAKLRLEPGDIDRLAAELSDILAHVRELATIDVTAVPPFTDVDSSPLRTDQGPADSLRTAPDEFGTDVRSGFFTVPRLSAQQRPDAE